MGALTDKYCIVGVGETPHMRPSNRTTLSMACEAISLDGHRMVRDRGKARHS